MFPTIPFHRNFFFSAMLNSNLLKNAVPSLVSHYWNYFKAAHRLWHGLKFTTFSEIWYSTLISALSLKTFSNWLLFRLEFVCQISFSINFLNLFLETQWCNSEPIYLFWLISTSQFWDKRFYFVVKIILDTLHSLKFCVWRHCSSKTIFHFSLLKKFRPGRKSVCWPNSTLLFTIYIYV